MPSLLPGYEYDIFISYRQKDNKGDHWVTEFVNALKTELESTFKEDISIYFDVNPHDGLHDHHDVDDSLREKLKSLILIPIVSRTYCDPKSFAWEHEFKAFLSQAGQDAFGLKIKLPGGNVANRVLPLRIHELEAEDVMLIETELQVVLRPIDFVFKSSGVNRPLLPTDKKEENNYHTAYRDQVNKVANAIKEITGAMISPVNRPVPQETIRSTSRSHPNRISKKTVILGSVGLAILFALIYGVSQLVTSPAVEPEILDTSVAVLPFVNISNDPEQEYFSDGITEQIITNLAHINTIKVIARTSVMKFKKSNKTIGEIGKELGVTHVLEGSIRKSDKSIRITAQLISVKDESHLWAQDYDISLADIFKVQDDVSMAIVNSLQRKLTPREYEDMKSTRTSNAQAYEHYLKGSYFHNDLYYIKNRKEDFLTSESEFKMAIELDSTYALSYAGLADLYDTYRNFSAKTDEERRKYEILRDFNADKAIRLGPNIPYVISVKAYSFSNKLNRSDIDIDSSLKYQRKAFSIAPNNVIVCDALSDSYAFLGLYYQAIALLERSISLNPTFGVYYARLGRFYIILGEYDKAEFNLKKAMLLEPDGITALNYWGFLSAIKKDFPEVEKAIKRIKEINPESNTNFFEAYLLAAKGEKDQALSKSKRAWIYLMLGMNKEALAALEKDRGIQYLDMKNSPNFNFLRNDPQFLQIQEKAKMVYEERLRKYTD